MIAAEYHDLDGRFGYVESAGDGAPVLCIHTAGQTAGQWRETLLALPGAGYRVLAPDLPGHGRSDPAPGEAVTDLTFYRDWCLALLDRLEIRAALLVGCSIGGRIALDIASHAPERAIAVVAMAANPRRDLISLSGLRRELEDSASASRGDRTFYGTLASLGSSVPPDRAATVATMHRREDPTVSTADLIGWTTHDLGSRLSRISAPVRLVAGEDDFWLDPGELEEMSALIADCTVEAMPGVGHYPMEELTDFPRLLAQWLDEATARSRRPEEESDG